MISALRTVAKWASGWAAALSAACAASMFLWLYASEVLAGYWRGSGAGQAPWRGFFDQSLYLGSAQAFASLSLDPARHFYPPVYALLAAPFTWLFPADPFVFVNVLCVAGSAALLVAMFGGAMGRLPAAVAALGFLALPRILQETFVIPWTSTPATLLVFMGLWRLARLESSRQASPAESFRFSALLGLIVATRPLDAVAAASLYPFWLAGLWRPGTGQTGAGRRRHLAPHLVALAAGGLIGPAILFGANVLIYGRLLSPYVGAMGSGDIFSWSRVAAKFVSLYLDSASLYVEPGQVILHRFPWMLPALLAVAACLAWGSLWLRAAALAATLQLLLYLPFDDLLPNGLYRYFNYHYFRWAFWLAFMMLPASVVLVHRRFGTRAWAIAGAASVAVLALACLQLRTTDSPVSPTSQAGRITVVLPAGRTDYVDLDGLAADWPKTYGPGQRVWLDERRLPFVSARFLQTATGTRLLFIHPVYGGTLELSAAQWRAGASAGRAGCYGFALGFPRWLIDRPAALPFGVPLRLDGAISSLIFESGFAGFDGYGQAIAGQDALLALPLLPGAPRYRLDLRFAAAEPVTITLVVDGSPSSGKVVGLGPGESDVSLDIPPAVVSRHGMTRVRLHRRGNGSMQEPGGLVVVGAKVEG